LTIFRIIYIVERFIDVQGLIFTMNGMFSTSEYDCEINGKDVSFYHNTKSHRYEIIINYDLENIVTFTKARGEAIIKFLKHLNQ